MSRKRCLKRIIEFMEFCSFVPWSHQPISETIKSSWPAPPPPQATRQKDTGQETSRMLPHAGEATAIPRMGAWAHQLLASTVFPAQLTARGSPKRLATSPTSYQVSTSGWDSSKSSVFKLQVFQSMLVKAWCWVILPYQSIFKKPGSSRASFDLFDTSVKEDNLTVMPVRLT